MATINRREFIRMGTGAALGATGMSASGCTTTGRTRRALSRERQPNLLFVMGDQWRRHALGFMNEDPVLTPNIDRVAEESMVFDNAISCCPICSPYRATLMSGRYPLSTGVITNNIMLPPGETCIADVLKGAGYDTAYVGKWHLDGEPWNHYTPPGPRRQGFDFWYANGCFHPHFQLCYWRDDPEPITGLGWQPDHETGAAIDYIKSHPKDRPFALFLSWAPPHTIHGAPRFDPKGKRFQYAAPQRFEALYKNKEIHRRPNVPDDYYSDALPGYFGAVTSLDENFGRLMTCLEEQGLADDTIVVLTADHGEMLGSHKRMTKCVYFEESIGVPFIIRWPGHVKARREDLILNSVDVMPSLLGLMGLRIPPAVEGVDFSPAMRGRAVRKPESALIEFFPGKTAHDKGWRGIRTPEYTFVAQKHEGPYCTLCDNQADPYQMHPKLARPGDDPLTDELWEELKRWLVQTHDPWLNRTS